MNMALLGNTVTHSRTVVHVTYYTAKADGRLPMYQISFSTVFLCQLHADSYICQSHTYVVCQSKCIGRDCFLLFSEKWIVCIILTMPMFVGSQSFISLPSFIFVGAAVSEIHESKQNKKKKNNLHNGCFQFNTFPEHIIDPFFHQSYLLTISAH